MLWSIEQQIFLYFPWEFLKLHEIIKYTMFFPAHMLMFCNILIRDYFQLVLFFYGEGEDQTRGGGINSRFLEQQVSMP